MPIRWRIALRFTLRPVTGSPSRRMSPESGSSSRLQQRSMVDLPDPDGPSTNTNSLCDTVRSMPFNASNVPKDLRKLRTSSEEMGLLMGVRSGLSGEGHDARALPPRHGQFGSGSAGRFVPVIDIAVIARLSEARDGCDRSRSFGWRETEPFFMQFRDGAVDLETFNHHFHRVAQFHVILAERHAPDLAGGEKIAGFHVRVLLCRPG